MSEREKSEDNNTHQNSVSLRRATQADWPLLRSWFNRPEMQLWWGSPSAVEAEIRIVFETPSALACIVECNGQPAGYTHAIDATFWGEDLPEGMPAGTWDIDIIIAEPAYRRRGIGRAALILLADELFSTTMALALSVIVSVKNEPAIRAYEKAGFKWIRLLDDPIFGASWLLLRERPK